MDGRDAEILARLMGSCRRPLREIADPLSISVAAVHKRIMAMEESGLIRRYRCLIHPALLGATATTIHGRCTASITQAACDAVGEHPSVFEVTIGSHNHIYVTLVSITAADVDSVLATLAARLRLSDPETLMVEIGRRPEHELSALDCGIVHGLAYKARRPISELARRLAVSDKVIARRLDLLMSAGALIFTVEFSTAVGGGCWTQLELSAGGVRRPEEMLRAAVADTGSLLLWISRFRFRRELMHAWVWSSSAGDLQALHDRLVTTSGVESVVPAMLFASHYYPIWIHERLESVWAAEAELQPTR